MDYLNKESSQKAIINRVQHKISDESEKSTVAVIDFIKDVEKRIISALENLAPRQRHYVPLLTLIEGGTAPIAVPFVVVRLGAPSKGHFWQVRMIRASTTDLLLGSSGTALLYVSSDDLRGATTVEQLPVNAFRDVFHTLPGVMAYPQGSLRVGSQESIYVAFVGLNPLDNVFASAEVYQYPDVDENIEWVT